MGSGADASQPVVTSICSGVDSSMACSWGAGRIMALGIRPLRDQHSPPGNFTGLVVRSTEEEETAWGRQVRQRDTFVGSHRNSVFGVANYGCDSQI